MNGKNISKVGITGSQGGLPSLTRTPMNEREKALIDSILQVVAHEIRNPLMAIGAFARKLVDTLDGSSGSARYAGIVLREAIRLEALLELMVDENRSNGENQCPSSPYTHRSDA